MALASVKAYSDEARWKEAFKAASLNDFARQRLKECISTRDGFIRQQFKLMSAIATLSSPSEETTFLTEIQDNHANIEKLNAGQWLDDDLLKIEFDNPFSIHYPHILDGPTGVDMDDVHEGKTTKDLLKIEEHVLNLLHIAVLKNCRSFETAYILSVWIYIRSQLLYRLLYKPRAYLHGFYKITQEENSIKNRNMAELVVLNSRLFLLKMMSLYHGYYNLQVPDEFEDMLNQLTANIGNPIEFTIVDRDGLLCRNLMGKGEVITERVLPRDPLRLADGKLQMVNIRTREAYFAELNGNYTLECFRIEPIKNSPFFKILPSISIGITKEKEDGKGQKKKHRGGRKVRRRRENWLRKQQEDQTNTN